MHTIGIDFGTSFCTASWVNPHTGMPEAIRFIENGQEKMPSVVYYSPEGPVVGQIAWDMIEKLNSYPPDDRLEIMMSIKQGIKREMDKHQKEYLPDGRVIRHTAIIADILAKVKSQAEEGCFGGEPVSHTVLTHPVEFAQWQKEMLIQAANQAGFSQCNLIEEPIAAAMGYAGSGAKVGNGILVYDFGGGTFDVAFVQRDGEEYRIPIAPEGEPFCGGEDIDLALYDHFEKQIFAKHKRTISQSAGHTDLQFKAQCRKHKEVLSRMQSHVFSEILPPPGELVRFQSKTSRQEFDAIIAPIIDKTIAKTRQLLDAVEQAGLQVDTVVLIGGSSRIPLVETELAKILPLKPLKTMHVDVAVAMGAVSGKKVQKSQPQQSGSEKDLWQGKLLCATCRKVLEPGSKFCIYCGSKTLVSAREELSGVMKKLKKPDAAPARKAVTTQPQNPEPQSHLQRCARCNNEVAAADKFCIHCGARLTTQKPTKMIATDSCRKCGKKLEPSEKFCTRCGTKR
jgi:molecular chaperone DnaK